MIKNVWSRTYYNGEKVRFDACGHTDGNVKIELESVGFAKVKSKKPGKSLGIIDQLVVRVGPATHMQAGLLR